MQSIYKLSLCNGLHFYRAVLTLERKKCQASGKDQLLVRPILANASNLQLCLHAPAWLAAAEGLHPPISSWQGHTRVCWAMTQLKPPKTHIREATHPWVNWASSSRVSLSGCQALPLGLHLAVVAHWQRRQQSKPRCLKKSGSPWSEGTISEPWLHCPTQRCFIDSPPIYMLRFWLVLLVPPCEMSSLCLIAKVNHYIQEMNYPTAARKFDI